MQFEGQALVLVPPFELHCSFVTFLEQGFRLGVVGDSRQAQRRDEDIVFAGFEKYLAVRDIKPIRAVAEDFENNLVERRWRSRLKQEGSRL